MPPSPGVAIVPPLSSLLKQGWPHQSGDEPTALPHGVLSIFGTLTKSGPARQQMSRVFCHRTVLFEEIPDLGNSALPLTIYKVTSKVALEEVVQLCNLTFEFHG